MYASKRVAENQTILDVGVKERLDAEMITRGEQTFLFAVPNGEAKIANQVLDTSFTPYMIGMEDKLGISGNKKTAASFGLQLLNKLPPAIHSRVCRDPD